MPQPVDQSTVEQFTKDPDAVLDYSFGWDEWLEDGDTIASATVTADAGITLDSQSNTTTLVTAWLSGGTALEHYKVTCRVTTTEGRTDDRTILIRVRER